ncbi:MAG: hypothetical protein PF692_11845 [Kiritimatiellae bacterium]|nr:hypothetical protein [Kiritimatiellia bacterium]
MSKLDYLENTHDLTLSDWGPYTKKYMLFNLMEKIYHTKKHIKAL